MFNYGILCSFSGISIIDESNFFVLFDKNEKNMAIAIISINSLIERVLFF